MGEEDHSALIDAPVGDGGGHVGLSGAVGAREYKPSARSIGISYGSLMGDPQEATRFRVLALPVRVQVIEGEASQETEIAVPQQSGVSFFVQSLLLAGARYNLAEVPVSDGHVRSEPAAAPAARALVAVFRDFL